jgi:hypothetical protein
MQTEFTCGIFTAVKYNGYVKWSLRINDEQIALIEIDGSTLAFSGYVPLLDADMLIEISVLINNIKRQHKQLQTTS